MKEELVEQLGFEVISTEDQKKELKEFNPFIAVLTEIKMPHHEALEAFGDVVLKRLTGRKTPMYTRDFSYKDGVLSFITEAELPPQYAKVYPITKNIEVYGVNLKGLSFMGDLVANTFPDFCWIISSGTNAYTAIEVQTPVREGALLGDLTWLLPSKFCDDLIENMHALNELVLEGTMQDAILYGPLFSVK